MLAVLSISTASFASHLVGGEIYYEWNGGVNYTVYLKAYRQCAQANAKLLDSTTLRLISNSMSYSRSFKVYVVKKEHALQPCAAPNSCINPASFLPGYEVYTYKAEIVVPLAASDWMIKGWMGSRVIADNITGGGTIGSAYLEATLDNTMGNNSSAHVPSLSPHVLPPNKMVVVPIQYVDVDGDSVVFQVADPMSDSTTANTYKNGYNSLDPLGVNGIYAMPPKGDSIVMMIPLQGVYVLSYRINEYRNGRLISSRNREFMFHSMLSADNTYPWLVSGLTELDLCPGQSHTITLNFKEKDPTDSVVIKPDTSIPNDISIYSNITNGRGAGSIQMTIIASPNMDPQTLPFFYVDIWVYDNYCPRNATKYSVLVRTRACTADSVWPGDANSDKIVNLLDPLAVALTYGDNGVARTGNPNAWVGDYADNWGTDIRGTVVDKKHADCNGDGTVDISDLGTIGTHWSKTHAKGGTMHKTTGVPDLYFDMTGIMFVTPGATIDVPVMLGNNSTPVDAGFYGMGTRFNVTINGGLPTAQTTVVQNYNWLGNSSNTLTFNKTIDNGTVYWAFSRRDKIGVMNTAYGQIGTLRYTVPSSAVSGDRIDLMFNETVMVDNLGVPITDFNAINAVAYVAPLSVGGMQSTFGYVSIIPNPSGNNAMLDVTLAKAQSIQLTVTDITGKQLWSVAKEMSKGTQQVALPASELPSGVYMVRISNSEGVQQTLKWVKQ